MAYIKKQSRTVDVFCFQEILRCKKLLPLEYRTTLYSDLAKILSDFKGVYCLVQEHITWFSDYERPVTYPKSIGLSYGLAMFVRSAFSFTSGTTWIYRHKNALLDDMSKRKDARLSPHFFRKAPDAMQHCIISRPAQPPLVIANLHGLWYPGTKGDSPNRLKQSRIIIDALSRMSGDTILCGDFNLMPNTKSIRMIESAGYHNLITEYKIPDTRGPINKKMWNDVQTFADFCFVSPGVKVKKFTVPQTIAVSDHLPMILDIA